jgi:hypothetical protein
MLAAALLRHHDIETRLSLGLSASEIVLTCLDWGQLQGLPNCRVLVG